MPAYVYSVRRRQPKRGDTAILAPDPPVVAKVEPATVEPVESPADIIPVASVDAETGAVEVAATPKPRSRKPSAKKKSDG